MRTSYCTIYAVRVCLTCKDGIEKKARETSAKCTIFSGKSTQVFKEHHDSLLITHLLLPVFSKAIKLLPHVRARLPMHLHLVIISVCTVKWLAVGGT
jgi:hypothetical protein